MKLKSTAFWGWSWRIWAFAVGHQIELEILNLLLGELGIKRFSPTLTSAGNEFGWSHTYCLREVGVNIVFAWKIVLLVPVVEGGGFPSCSFIRHHCLISPSPLSSFVRVCARACVRASVCVRMVWRGDWRAPSLSLVNICFWEETTSQQNEPHGSYCLIWCSYTIKGFAVPSAVILVLLNCVLTPQEAALLSKAPPQRFSLCACTWIIKS